MVSFERVLQRFTSDVIDGEEPEARAQSGIAQARDARVAQASKYRRLTPVALPGCPAQQRGQAALAQQFDGDQAVVVIRVLCQEDAAEAANTNFIEETVAVVEQTLNNGRW